MNDPIPKPNARTLLTLAAWAVGVAASVYAGAPGTAPLFAAAPVALYGLPVRDQDPRARYATHNRILFAYALWGALYVALLLAVLLAAVVA